MFRLLEFIRSTYVVILFIIAEVIAISNYANSSSYTRAKIFVVTNSVVGGVNGIFHNTRRLFDLPMENRELSKHIAELQIELDRYSEMQEMELSADQIYFENPDYTYVVGRVVSNSINKRDNYIVIDKGIDDGIYEKMAVITPSGKMLGYVEACTGHYSAALSLLSSSFTTSAKLKEGSNFGSISWSGESRYQVSMSELSKYEPINIGDTVVSTGFSKIFPGGVTIGRVASFEFNEMQTAYNVEVDIEAEITAIDFVLLVGSRESAEIEDLLESVGGVY